MRPETREWVQKAEGDFATLRREMRARRDVNYDAACFHASQCIEKYLKGLLVDANIPFPKTHDLARLTALLGPAHPLLAIEPHALDLLTSYAVLFRYPGESATAEQACTAFQHCKRLRTVLREAIEQPPGRLPPGRVAESRLKYGRPASRIRRKRRR